jgi:hypothetical protein
MKYQVIEKGKEMTDRTKAQVEVSIAYWKDQGDYEKVAEYMAEYQEAK